ncbi:EAL domain-containing response regulator [Nevskia soli]|uniref:EAL domain-containing response regulator n=1 Tax=Nevskia soli TaxID=418856 RepID=UPI0004A7305E|nr:EAL domain-containing protein [Nevskia soli]
MTQLPSALLSEASGVLLVITTAEEVAKRIESHLRNAGHPLRVAWITDLEDLQDVLQRNPPDLVLCDENARKAPAEKVIALANQMRPDLPVVVISNDHSVEDAVAALAAGAQDFVSYSDLRQLRHLELVVVREFVKHHHMRNLRLTQQRLADFESRHQQLTEGTADAVAHVQEGILANANLAFTHLIGYDEPAELAGQPLIDLVAPDQQSKIKERLRAVQKGKHNGEPLELVLVGRKGQVHVKAQLILGTQDGESVIELLIRAEGGKGRPASAQAAFHGRGMFSDALAEAAPADGKSMRTAMLLHIDSFDALEQRIGHADAQEVTSLLAETVHTRLGPQDQSFVFSTDELALLVQRPNYNEAEQFAEFLRKEISGHIFAARQHEAHISLTITVFPLGGQEAPEQVIRQLADEARKISARGGNQIVALGATAKANQVEREEARRAAQVKKAIEDNRLKLAYQSIASLEGESRSHFDVLVRMLDESGKELHAAEFLPAAQKFNLMRTIDRWVVARALGVIAKRAASKEASVLFVKLSEDTLKDNDGFITWLKALVQEQPLKSDEIVFEIQEVVIQNHVRKAKALTQALREMGAGLAVEHFGVGANSAQLMDHIPANFIKFHPSFTQKFSEKDTQKRLGDLVEAAKQHGLKTIVSHVEDAHVMARLWQMGVNFIQGYHVQEPEVVLLASDIAGGRG